MLYPVYVHKDENSAFGATIPDFPGCFSAADDWGELPQKVREAVELYFEGEDLPIPAASSISTLEVSVDYTGGQWVFIDINIAKLNTKAVRLNITLPEGLVSRIDDKARASGMSRSGFLAVAAEKELNEVRG